MDKAWYGPVKVITHESNSVFVIDRNTLRKLNVTRCMPFDERQHSHKDPNTAKPDELPPTIGLDVPLHEVEVKTEDPDDQDQPPVSARTWSKSISFDETKNVDIDPDISPELQPKPLEDDLKTDSIAAYYIRVAGKEDLNYDSVLRVKIPRKNHDREDVKEAKIAEMKNLTTHQHHHHHHHHPHTTTTDTTTSVHLDHWQ